jgi:lipoyl(octanoyl) transferase
MILHVLPTRTAGAAENMAVDFLLLQRYPDQNAPRFRHYEWRSPAFTFGYSQKIDYVRANLPAVDGRLEVVRRATGGGIVDHRNDWTYALVLPRGLALYDARATQAYHDVHQCMVTALLALGQPVELKARCEPEAACEGEPAAALPTICFVRAELYDVLNATTGQKVAGAAMKRNKHGLLFQGSIEKSRLGTLDWERFGEAFTAALGKMLGGTAQATPWPELAEDEVAGLTEQYASPEWNESR